MAYRLPEHGMALPDDFDPDLLAEVEMLPEPLDAWDLPLCEILRWNGERGQQEAEQLASQGREQLFEDGVAARPARPVPHSPRKHLDDLGRRGVAFRSLLDPVDTSTATGRMMLGIFASFAQFERDLISERVMAGLAAIKASGTPLGRPSRVHPQQVALIHQLAAEGKSQRKIAALTGLSRPLVQAGTAR